MLVTLQSIFAISIKSKKLTKFSSIAVHRPISQGSPNLVLPTMGNRIYSVINPYLAYFYRFNIFRLQSSRSLIEPPSSSADSNSQPQKQPKKLEEWNLRGLKDETSRQYLRAYKKVEKANERLQKAMANPPTPENDKVIEELKLDLEHMKRRLDDVYTFEEDLKKIKSMNDKGFSEIIERAMVLEINDSPPPRVEHQKVKKPKVETGPRKPYYTYTSLDNIKIRVGRSAADNDELSLRPEYREGAMWWMHVAGSPGSHVVICNTDDNFPTLYRQTLIDAALLAAVNSKGSGGRIQVTYTRCRNVTKPYGAKPGLVYLSGDVATTRVDINAETARLARLTETKEY